MSNNKPKKTFYDLVKNDPVYESIVNNPLSKNINNFKEINNSLKFPLRPYQIEALSAFDIFWNNKFDSRGMRNSVIQSVDGHQWPKIGFEMATGSGKTLLMGAIVRYLYNYGYEHFLILTPNTILFDKTIENFTPRDINSVFGDGWNLSFNIVTGDSYRDKTCGYNKNKDVSFHIFNMQKFYEKGTPKGKNDTMKGVPYVRRPLEESLWRSEDGNHTISFIEFLQNKKLVVISDEAHHYQQKTTKNAINELIPSIVMEFTATSLEKGESEKFGQDNLYKYSMQRYIGEGYGKRIFAMGSGANNEQYTENVTESDKQKLIWGILLHLLKKKALKRVGAPVSKPMMLIKCRKIEHAENVHKYLEDWINNVGKEFDDVLEQINHEQKDIIKLLRKYISFDAKNRKKLLNEMNNIAKTVFTIHSKNKTDEEIWSEYKSLDNNKAEIVNQVKVFTEGVDYDNFYTIIVLGDSNSNIGVAAAQLIGRGLRLYKEKREFDLLDHDLKEQNEILHVICEKGRRFDKIIEDIRKKLQLSPSTIEVPVEEETNDNKIRKKLPNNYLPILKIKNISTGKTFEDVIKNKNLSITNFINYICGKSGGHKVLKPEIISMIEEVEITSNENITNGKKPKTRKATITIKNDEAEKWAWRFLDNAGSHIGDNSYSTVLNLINNIFKADIKVEVAYDQDYRKALKALEKSFNDYYINGSRDLMFERKYEIKPTQIKNIFKNSSVVIRKRSDWTNLLHCYQPLTPHLHQKGVVVEGYKYSLRPYVKLDTSPEKWVVDKLEKLCEKDKTKKSFWVRNEPQTEYAVEVVPASFYPDFLIYYKGTWAVVDVKGKHLAGDQKIEERKKALFFLENKGNIKSFFLVDEVMADKGFQEQKINSLKDLEGFDELHSGDINLDGFTNGKIKNLFDT